MARPDPLRVFIDVPQAYAGGIKVGDKVKVTQPELAGAFAAEVTRIAGAINVTTRSQTIELTLPNPEGVLTPGAYVQVSLPQPPKGPLTIPANTLLFRSEGPSVVIVDAEGKAHLRPIGIVNDLGADPGNRGRPDPGGQTDHQPAGFDRRRRQGQHALADTRGQKWKREQHNILFAICST